LSAEVSAKLKHVRPATLGQARRISGVTPAAISLLLVHLHRLRGARAMQADRTNTPAGAGLHPDFQAIIARRP
jgi:hypothetical protein